MLVFEYGVGLGHNGITSGLIVGITKKKHSWLYTITPKRQIQPNFNCLCKQLIRQIHRKPKFPMTHDPSQKDPSGFFETLVIMLGLILACIPQFKQDRIT